MGEVGGAFHEQVIEGLNVTNILLAAAAACALILGAKFAWGMVKWIFTGK